MHFKGQCIYTTNIIISKACINSCPLLSYWAREVELKKKKNITYPDIMNMKGAEKFLSKSGFKISHVEFDSILEK